jgi:hypothetical protein
VTDRTDSYHALIRRPPSALAPLAALGVLTLTLAGCGGQHSTLPPPPGASGQIALGTLARHPEVYAGATIQTVGTVARARSPRPARPLFQLDGGHGVRIVLAPAARVAHELGHRVRVEGLFTLTFQLGYEILVSHVRLANGSL